MGYLSQAGFLGLRTQSVRGTYADPGAPNLGIYMKTTQGAMGINRTLLIPDPEIGGNRDMPSAELSEVSYSGTYDFYARMDSLATLLRAALGTSVDSTSGGPLATVSDGATTSASPTVTSVTAAFVAGDVGKGISGAGIPANSYIGVVNSGTSIALSSSATANTPVNATATATGVTLTFVGRTSATQIGTHVINSATALPWLSLEEQIANSFENYHYTDAKVDSLKLSVQGKGYLMGNLSMQAITQLAGVTPTVANVQNWDTTPQTVSTNVSIAYNGVTLPAKSMDFEIKNNLEKDDSRLGQFVVGDITEKRRELSISAKIRPTDHNLWRQAANGSSSATAPGGSPTRAPVVLTFTTWEFIGSTITPYSLSISCPVAIVEPFNISPAKDDVLEESLSIKAFRPNNGTDIATFTCVNDLATVY